MHESIEQYRKIMAEDSSQRQVYDVRARLPLLTVQRCMIWGGSDRSAPLDPLGHGMHALFPKVPFHVVAGSGHQVQNDEPEECNRLLLDFLQMSAGEPTPALAPVGFV